jgi:hypothetical protein
MINMDAKKNRRVIATIFVAALVSVIVPLINFSSSAKYDKVTAEGEYLVTTSIEECSTTATTTTSTSTTTKKTTSTSTSTTSTTTTETTTVATTAEQIVETEPVAPDPTQPESQSNGQIIGGNGTVTVNGWTFNSPIDAQYLNDRCAAYGIDPSIMYGVMMAESTMGTACANLCGITDVAAQSYNNSTGNGYYNWSSDPYQNVEISLYCLSGAYNYYGNGSTYDALAGYNTGYYGHAAGTYSWYAETVMGYANSAY